MHLFHILVFCHKIRDCYINWEDDELIVVRFLIPSKYNSLEKMHKVVIVCSKTDVPHNPIRPDFYYQNKIRDFMCTCQCGLRSLGRCVLTQVAIQGAKISNSDKLNFRRNFVTLGQYNFMAEPEAKDCL